MTGQGGKEPPALLSPQPSASSLLALQGAAPGVFRPCPASGADSSADQQGTEHPHTACSRTGGSGSSSTGGTGTEMGFGSHEAPGRCAQHLSKGAASSPLVGRMGLGGISGEL